MYKSKSAFSPPSVGGAQLRRIFAALVGCLQVTGGKTGEGQEVRVLSESWGGGYCGRIVVFWRFHSSGREKSRTLTHMCRVILSVTSCVEGLVECDILRWVSRAMLSVTSCVECHMVLYVDCHKLSWLWHLVLGVTCFTEARCDSREEHGAVWHCVPSVAFYMLSVTWLSVTSCVEYPQTS